MLAKTSDRRLILSANWAELLQQFCLSTGLVAMLLDKNNEVLIEPRGGSNYSEYMSKLMCKGNKRTLAKVLEDFSTETEINDVKIKVLNSLGFAMVPISNKNKEVVCKALVGFIPTHFIDPVETNQLARSLEVDYNELWHYIRGQQPINKNLLEAQATFLKHATNSYLAEIEAKNYQKDLAYHREITADGIMQITKCESLESLAQTIYNAAAKFTDCKSVTLRLYRNDNDIWAESYYEDEKRTYTQVSEWRTIAYDIKGTKDENIAKIYFGFTDSDIKKSQLFEKINPLLLSLGIAIQRLILISDLKGKEKDLDALNKELQMQDESKDSFISALSHDLRAPLSSIMGWISVYRNFEDTEQRKEAIESIENAGNKQLRLINDLLDLTRIRSGKFHIEKQPTDIKSLTKDVYNSYRIQAQNKNIQLTYNSAIDSQIIEVDANRIEQAISNLLDNAFKFTKAGGQIHINLSSSEDNVQISVKDTGMGLSEEDKKHIFSKYFQKTLNRKGLGLGLTIVQEILKGHEGEIQVTSDGQNKGSEFIISLPLKKVARRPNMHAENSDSLIYLKH